MSRDEQNVLVVSYAELKNCLEQSYGEVRITCSLYICTIHFYQVLSAATTKPKHNHMHQVRYIYNCVSNCGLKKKEEKKVTF